MEIQQKERESLAAYTHRCKREANRCNFNNNAAMIWIFIKGLRNAHTLATRVYEKGPQNLADAIREVERLPAAQQLTATLLPSSRVNIMLSEDDKCFQCQESGHMACHCPIQNVLIVMNVVMLQQTAQTKYLHQVHLHDTENIILAQDTILDPHLAIITGTNTGLTGQDHIPTVTDTEVTAGVIHRKVTLGHITDVHTEAHLTTDTQTLIITKGHTT